MTYLTLPTWRCDYCDRTEALFGLTLACKTPHKNNPKFFVHLCTDCAHNNITICLLCYRPHNLLIPCSSRQTPYLVSEVYA